MLDKSPFGALEEVLLPETEAVCRRSGSFHVYPERALVFFSLRAETVENKTQSDRLTRCIEFLVLQGVYCQSEGNSKKWNHEVGMEAP